MTNVLCEASSREQVAWRQVVELAMAGNVPLVPIVLETAAEENISSASISPAAGKQDD
jgi:hypothetical protein